MFDILKAAVTKQFAEMAKNELFTVDTVKNELFDAYLAAFPEVERQEHNCNCCKSFLNQYGNIVAIKNGKVMTVWDVAAPEEYRASVEAVNAIVRSKAINNPFVNTFAKLGTDFNFAKLEDGSAKRWTHFFVQLPVDKVNRSGFSNEKIAGDKRTTKEVFQRSLETITLEATQTTLELIDDNAIYRGAEFRKQVQQFATHQQKYAELNNEADKSLYVWVNYVEGGRIRNTAIGTLLINLSEGMSVDAAVRAFESVMAPANYKRTTAIVTPKMIAQAQEKINEMGYGTALKRRHATKDDIPLDNLLFVNRDSTDQGDVFAQLTAAAPKGIPKNVRKVALDEFISTTLKGASNVQLYLENSHNFVSLIAPQDEAAPSMFHWGNGVSWTYQNNMTDVIKEKVKNAGGNVAGELRVSLEWFNHDDLDLHVITPKHTTVNFRSRTCHNTGGVLDVDMNAGMGKTRTPVENIVFATPNVSMEGTYTVKVHNFSKRENIDLGFNLQIECKGVIHNLGHSGAVASQTYVDAVQFDYSRKDGVTNIKTILTSSTANREVAGLQTNNLHKVNMLMFSPNHWAGDKGNKHLFVILDGAKIDEPLRPFFNEYLSNELMENRKVLELLGSKLMVPPTNDQVTGVGVSLTQAGQSLMFKVDDKFVNVVI